MFAQAGAGPATTGWSANVTKDRPCGDAGLLGDASERILDQTNEQCKALCLADPRCNFATVFHASSNLCRKFSTCATTKEEKNTTTFERTGTGAIY